MGQGKGRLRGPLVFSSILKSKVPPERSHPPSHSGIKKPWSWCLPALSSFCVHPSVLYGGVILDDQGLSGNPTFHRHSPAHIAYLETIPFCSGIVLF